MTSKDAQDLANKVKGFLNGQGYPLEMRVAQVFREAGFIVSQAVGYKDLTTNALREMDVVASLDIRGRKNSFSVSFYIECKVNQDRPFVLFSEHAEPISRSTIFMTHVASRFGNEFLHALMEEFSPFELQLFKGAKRHLYGITTAKLSNTGRANEDMAYEATRDVISAVRSRIKDLNETRERFKPHNYGYGEVVIPIVVIRDHLFEVFLGADGRTIEVAELGGDWIALPNPDAPGQFPISVLVVTETELPRFVESFKAGIMTLSDGRALEILESLSED